MRGELEKHSPRAASAAAAPSETPGVSPAAGAPALHVGTTGGTAARRAAGRFVRRPMFWVAVTVLVLLVCFVLFH